jgi:osmoprotectant transport system permease protein
MQYMIQNFDLVLAKLVEHMQITLTAVLLAIVIGVPLGVIATRYKNLGNGILGVANVFQTIPSLALFGFIIPIPLIGGIGYRPAVVVLFLYALLPIIKNTYIGIRQVDPSVIESAKGMGMTSGQILFMISLPLSFPVIMGGIRVATVINIGTATIAALIGAGGLGDFIFRGISNDNINITLAGAIPTTVLALIIDYLLGIIENRVSVNFFGQLITNKKLRKKVLVTLIVIAVIISGFYVYSRFDEKETIRIGTKNFTESRLLGEMLAIYIAENTDLETDVREFGGTAPAFRALHTGNIDTYVEYTGTGYLVILKKEGDIPTSQEVYDIVSDEFNELYGISWMPPLGFNNTYTLAVTQAVADQYNLETFSDLAPFSNALAFGCTAELLEREDGFPGLVATYGYDFNEIRELDPGLRYNAIANNLVQVIDAFSTDGKIVELELVILEDDQEYFPPYFAAPIVNNETLERHPELEDLFLALENVLDDQDMQRLNYEVDVIEREPRDVAREFLLEEGLIE